MAASENRAEGEGIKRALSYLQTAAGTFDFLLKEVLPQLTSEISTLGGAGYDMTESFVQTMRDFCLAEAQECFWQKAVLGKYGHASFLTDRGLQERHRRETVPKSVRLLRRCHHLCKLYKFQGSGLPTFCELTEALS